MSQTILVIGRTFSRLTGYLEHHGFEFIVLADGRKPLQFPEKSIVCDFSDPGAVLAAADQAKQTHDINAVFAIYENYILPASLVAQHLGLPGIPIAAAEACTDKQRMRELFAQAQQPISPDFALVENLASLEAFAKSHTFPLVLKPANLAKSLLVTKNHSTEELLTNYRLATETIGSIYERYAPDRVPKLLVEEFLEGSIHSVDAFVDKNGRVHVLEQVVDYQTGYDVGYDDNFHYSRLLPSRLPSVQVAEIRRVAEIGCKALGMKSSAAHIEIILTANGPRIVEIGARNGGYRERMHELANGIDIVGNAVALAMGADVQLHASRNDNCAVLELFPKLQGAFSHVEHEKQLKQLASLAYYRLKAEPGKQVGKAAHGHKMCAVIMLHNADHAQFEQDLQFVNQHVHVVTK